MVGIEPTNRFMRTTVCMPRKSGRRIQDDGGSCTLVDGFADRYLTARPRRRRWSSSGRTRTCTRPVNSRLLYH